MPKFTLASYIRKAKEAIGTEENWAQSNLHSEGAHCALGALEVAEPELEELSSASMPENITSRMRRAIKIMVQIIKGHKDWRERANPEPGDSEDGLIATFNDDERTSHADIMKLFSEAARRAKVKESK